MAAVHFYTMGGGDVDDQSFLSEDLKNPDSQLSKILSKAKELAFTPVIILDGGYWEKSADAVIAAGGVPWIKDNGKTRQESEFARAQDNQMVIRSGIERSNHLNAKGLGRLRRPAGFHDIFRIEDMMAISLGISILKDRPLSRPTGALPRHQFADISDDDLDKLDRQTSLRTASRAQEWLSQSLCSVR